MVRPAVMGKDDMATGAAFASSLAAQPLIRFDAVTKRFGGVTAVDHLSLDIGHSEFFALLGPSGCGKTTLLRLLAGFGQPDEGRILLDGEDISAMPATRSGRAPMRSLSMPAIGATMIGMAVQGSVRIPAWSGV